MTESELQEIEKTAKLWPESLFYVETMNLINEIRRLKHGPSEKEIEQATDKNCTKGAHSIFSACDNCRNFKHGVQWRDAWNESTNERGE